MRGALVVLAALTLACSEGPEAPGGVDQDQMVSELSLEEVVSVCEFFEERIAQVDVILGCYGYGMLTGGGVPERCAELVAECLEDPLAFGVEPWRNCSFTELDLEKFPACASEVTLREYNSCRVGALGNIESVVDELILCEGITDPGIHPACKILTEKCPSLHLYLADD
jgi:hypothetical protein